MKSYHAPKAIHAKRKTIPLSKVRGTHEVSRYHLEDLAESTRVKPPILVIESRSGKTYQILDGHHRTALARRDERETIQAYVVPRAAYRTHIDWIDWVQRLYGAFGNAVAPMSLDEIIVVTWRGKVRTYTYMRAGAGIVKPIVS